MSEILPLYQVNEESVGSLMKIGRIRTLTLLRRLDGKRKGSVLQFLYESNLIGKTGVRYIDLSGADLTKAKLKGANLTKADLSKVNLYGSYMKRANLNSAYLINANLRGAILTGADLSIADLTGADLSIADLTGANLSDAKLYGADLSGADLRDATGIVTKDLEKKAKSLQGATMPDGKIHL
jgi:uncharacterized protein YjbI with pentapeptide repeats